MTKRKRTPATSPDNLVKAMENAAAPELRPPEHLTLRAQDLPFWSAIMAARSRGEWTEADLVLAVSLARCQADIETAQKELDASALTLTLTTDKGAEVAHPLVGVRDRLLKSQMAMRRDLRMGGNILGATDVLNVTRQTERKAKAAVKQVEEEDSGLIA